METRHPRSKLTPHDAFAAAPSLIAAVSSLYDSVVDRILATPEPVTSAAEGRALLAPDEDTTAVTDNIQRVVVIAVPVLRTLARSARVTRVPWVLVATSTLSVGTAVRTGIRELQVIAALVSHRLENETGRVASPALVKKLALEVYLAPRKKPDTSDLGLPLGRLLRRWLVKGALGRDSAKAVHKALDAVERLDVRDYV
jgi:hypothetical protein